MQHNIGSTTESNVFAGYSQDPGGTRLADDYTVPPGSNKTINRLVLYSYRSGAAAGPSPFSTATVRVWTGRPGDAGAVVLCGNTSTNRLVKSTDTNIFRIFNTSVPAPGFPPNTNRKLWRNQIALPAPCDAPGFFVAGNTYWFEWDMNGGGFHPSIVVPGARTRAGANARIFTFPATWTDVIDTGSPASASDELQELNFELAFDPTLLHADGFE